MSVVGILELFKFEKDPSVLTSQTGLKAAAKFWSKKDPKVNNPELTKEISDAFKIIELEMRKRREQNTNGVLTHGTSNPLEEHKTPAQK